MLCRLGVVQEARADRRQTRQRQDRGQGRDKADTTRPESVPFPHRIDIGTYEDGQDGDNMEMRQKIRQGFDRDNKNKRQTPPPPPPSWHCQFWGYVTTPIELACLCSPTNCYFGLVQDAHSTFFKNYFLHQFLNLCCRYSTSAVLKRLCHYYRSCVQKGDYNHPIFLVNAELLNCLFIKRYFIFQGGTWSIGARAGYRSRLRNIQYQLTGGEWFFPSCILEGSNDQLDHNAFQFESERLLHSQTKSTRQPSRNEWDDLVFCGSSCFRRKFGQTFSEGRQSWRWDSPASE